VFVPKAPIIPNLGICFAHQQTSKGGALTLNLLILRLIVILVDNFMYRVTELEVQNSCTHLALEAYQIILIFLNLLLVIC
jgi:hypothetical protein